MAHQPIFPTTRARLRMTPMPWHRFENHLGVDLVPEIVWVIKPISSKVVKFFSLQQLCPKRGHIGDSNASRRRSQEFIAERQ
jgi:hypothetical protein